MLSQEQIQSLCENVGILTKENESMSKKLDEAIDELQIIMADDNLDDVVYHGLEKILDTLEE